MKKQRQRQMKYALCYGEYSNNGDGDSSTIAKFSNLKEARKAFTHFINYEFDKYYKPCLKWHKGYSELALERIPTEDNDCDLIIDAHRFYCK